MVKLPGNFEQPLYPSYNAIVRDALVLQPLLKGGVREKAAPLIARPQGVSKDYQLFLGSDGGVYRYRETRDNQLLVAPKHAVGDKSVTSFEQRQEQLNRLTMLVHMRDAVNEIYTLQRRYSDEDIATMDAPPWARAQARLNDVYDSFVATFGPLNKQRAVKTGQIKEDGARNIVYTRPNMRQFHKDPDAERVAAIEIFNAATNTAEKDQIFFKRVVEPDSPRHAQTPVEDLMQGLSDTNQIDFDAMRALLGEQAPSTEDLQNQLEEQGLLFFDPAQKKPVYAARYLSGNVRKKLQQAQRAEAKNPGRYAANIAALQLACPKELAIEEIAFSLGDYWIPPGIVEQFAREVLGIDGAVVNYLNQIHYWSVEGQLNYEAHRAEHLDYATDYFSQIDLLGKILNHERLGLRKRKDDVGNLIDRDRELDLAAYTQRRIADRFQDWVRAHPAHSAALVKKYHDLFRSNAAFQADGSHLSFPGKAVTITPYTHQNDAVWRAMQTGNMLFAAAVGSGKTLFAALEAAKLKQVGAIKTPLIVVPDSILHQFSGEFVRALPMVNILKLDDKYADQDAQQRIDAKSKLESFAKLAQTGDYDAVFMSQSSYDRFQAHPRGRLQARLEALRNLEKTLDEDLTESAYTKLCEKMDKARLRIINDLGVCDASAASADKLAVWHSELQEHLYCDANHEVWQDYVEPDEHFIDHRLLGDYYLILDEAHNYKNLFIESFNHFASKAGSVRANDLYYKLQDLRRDNPHGYATMMTATPISNALDEVFTWQRYLQPDQLEALGLDDYDVWRSVFHGAQDVFEVLPEGGSYREIERAILFDNLEALSNMFDSFTQKVLPEDLNLPKPRKQGGGAQIITIDRPAYLDAFMEDLANQGTELRTNVSNRLRMSPEEYQERLEVGEDIVFAYCEAEALETGLPMPPCARNFLELLNKMRYATLHPQMAGLAINQPLNGKIEALVNNVARIYDEHKDQIYIHPKTGEAQDTPGALQMIMCDLGVPKSDGQFSPYEAIKQQLIERGIPAQKIAFVHDATTDEQMARLQEKARNGDISVILGTTDKLGTGTNIQRRLIAAHNLDLPWRPDQWIQRNGRADRPGNWNEEIQLYDYIMKGSADTYITQLLERKARFIHQIMYGISAEESTLVQHFTNLRTAAANDDDFVGLMQMQEELAILSKQRDTHNYAQHKRRFQKKSLERQRETVQQEYSLLQKINAQATYKTSKYHPLRPKGKAFETAYAAGAKMRDALADLRDDARKMPGQTIGRCVGTLYGINLMARMKAKKDVNPQEDQKGRYLYEASVELDGFPETALEIFTQDFKRNKDEKTLSEAFDELQQSSDSQAEFSSEFCAIAADLQERFTQLADKIAAPYQNLDRQIKDLIARECAIDEELALISASLECPFEQEVAHKALAKKIKAFKQRINKKRQSTKRAETAGPGEDLAL